MSTSVALNASVVQPAYAKDASSSVINNDLCITLESDDGSDDDNEVDLVNVPEDDRKTAAQTYHDSNDDSNCDDDFEVGGEEDELD